MPREVHAVKDHDQPTRPPLPIGDIERRLAILRPNFQDKGFPWLQAWGFAGSVLLTVAAYVLVAGHRMAPTLLLVVVLVMAASQAVLQLAAFMHLRESRGLAWHVIPIGLAMLTAMAMVAMSIWIMTFKSGVS